jgi:site-specific recombinase XerD
LIEKLADLDLIHREYLPDVPDTLEAFITEYIEKRTDVKEGTLVTYRQVRKRLVDHFGAGRRLSDTATGDAKQWRRLLLEGGFSEATANRSSATAIQYFNEAIDLKVITVNPFKGLPVVVRGNHDRYHFVDRPIQEFPTHGLGIAH